MMRGARWNMADRCGFLLADSHLCSELKGHYASPHQWRAEDEEVWVAVENIARRKTLEPTYTAAQLSQAVEAAQGQYVYTAAQMEIERFKSKVEGSNEVLLAVLYELGYSPPEDEAIGLGRVKRELNRKLEAAQGAMLEAAVTEIRDMSYIPIHMRQMMIQKLRALQTEPMAAALAARDKQSQKWPSSVPGGEEPNYPPPVMEAGGNSLTYRGFRWKRVMPETEAARKETL